MAYTVLTHEDKVIVEVLKHALDNVQTGKPINAGIARKAPNGDLLETKIFECLYQHEYVVVDNSIERAKEMLTQETEKLNTYYKILEVIKSYEVRGILKLINITPSSVSFKIVYNDEIRHIDYKGLTIEELGKVRDKVRVLLDEHTNAQYTRQQSPF